MHDGDTDFIHEKLMWMGLRIETIILHVLKTLYFNKYCSHYLPQVLLQDCPC